MNKKIFFAPLVCLILCCIVLLLTPVVPLVGFFSPLLIMLFGAFSLFRNSKIVFYSGSVVIMGITAVVAKNSLGAVVCSLGYILAGFLLCFTVLRRKSSVQTIITVLVCLLVADYGSIVIDDLMSGRQAFSFIEETFTMLKPEIVESLKQGASGLSSEQVEQAVTLTMDLVRMFMPAMLIIICLIVTVFLSFLVKTIVNKTLGIVAIDLPFSRFKADRITVFMFFLSAIVSLFAGDSIMSVAFNNIYMILNVVLYFCGLSLINWYFKDVKKLHFILRVLILILIGSISLVPVILALIDSGRNFRLIGKTESDN